MLHKLLKSLKSKHAKSWHFFLQNSAVKGSERTGSCKLDARVTILSTTSVIFTLSAVIYGVTTLSQYDKNFAETEEHAE